MDQTKGLNTQLGAPDGNRRYGFLKLARSVKPYTSASASAQYTVVDDGSGLLLSWEIDTLEIDPSLIEWQWTGRRLAGHGHWRTADYLFLVRFAIPLDYKAEFIAWYIFEHAPLLLEEPDWHSYVLLEADIASDFNIAALHFIHRPETLDCLARARSRSTPWWLRLSKNNWFDEPFQRLLLAPSPAISRR